MFSSIKAIGIVLIKDIGIDPKAIMGSGFTLPPIKFLEPSSMCRPVFAMSPPAIGTSRMEMSERTGRHGKGISTGKSTEEGSGMEKRDGNPTGTATIKGKAEEGTAIEPILAGAHESPGERVPCACFPGLVFKKRSLCSLRPGRLTWREYFSHSPGRHWIECRRPDGTCQNPSQRTYRHGRSKRC